MDNPIILREQLLSKFIDVAQTCKKDGRANVLEFVGNAGMGKTVFLNSIPDFLNEYGITADVLKINAEPSGNLLKQLSKVSQKRNIQKWVSDENFKNDYWTFFRKLKSPRKDILIIIIDDAHLLEAKLIQSFKMMFSSEFTYQPHLLILCGKPNNNFTNSVEIGPFSDKEFHSFIGLNYYNKWHTDFPKQFEYLQKVSQNSPFYLSELVRFYKEQKLIQSDYTAPLDQIKNTKIPNSISDIFINELKSKMSKEEQNLLFYLAISLNGLRKKELSILLNNSKNISKILKVQIQRNWIIKGKGNYYKIKHDLQKNAILSLYDKDEIINAHTKCLKLLENSDSSKAHHLFNSNLKFKKDVKFLYNYAKTLSNANQHHTSLNIFQKIDGQFGQFYPYEIGMEYKFLGDLENAKKHLLISAKNSIHANRYLDLAIIYKSLGELKNCEKYLHKGLKLKRINPEVKTNIYLKLAILLFDDGKADAGKKMLESAKSVSLLKKRSYLDFLKTQAHINTKFNLGLNQEKLIKDSIKYSKKIKADPFMIANLESDLQVYYLHSMELDKAEYHGKRARKHLNKQFDPFLSAELDKLEASIHLNRGDVAKALEVKKRLLNKYKILNMPTQRLEHAARLAITYLETACYLPTFFKLVELLPKIMVNIPLYDVEALRPIMQYHFWFGDHSEGEAILNKAIKSWDSKEFKLHIMLAKVYIYPFLLPKNPEIAESNFIEGFDYYADKNAIARLCEFYTIKGWTLIRNEKFELLENLCKDMEEWLSFYKDFGAYLVFNTILQFKNQNINSGKGCILDIESIFDGSFAFYIGQMYQWISDQPYLPKTVRNRSNYIADLIDRICRVDLGKSVEKYSSDDKGILLFLKEWYNALCQKRPFSEEILDKISTDQEMRESIEANLGMWNLAVKDIDPDQNFGSNVICINLIGTPEIIINDRKLSSKDWISKKSLELLIYIIVSNWKKKSAVSLNAIIHDIWSPSKERLENVRLVRNTIISRIRKMFIEIEENILITEGDRIRFNFESSQIRIDLDLFFDASQKGQLLIKEEEYSAGIHELELAINLVRGHLADGFDGIWLESIRTFVISVFNENINALKIAYRKQKQIDKIIDLEEKYNPRLKSRGYE